MEWINAETATLIGVGLASFLSAFGIAGRSKKVDGPKKPETSMHQEVVRPVTEADLRQAAALERIAGYAGKMVDQADRIERHLDVLLSRRG